MNTVDIPTTGRSLIADPHHEGFENSIHGNVVPPGEVENIEGLDTRAAAQTGVQHRMTARPNQPTNTTPNVTSLMLYT